MLDKWLTLKIGDFGFARAGDQEKGFKSVLVTKLGTPEYRAPDIYIDTPGSNVGGTGARLPILILSECEWSVCICVLRPAERLEMFCSERASYHMQASWQSLAGLLAKACAREMSRQHLAA